MAVGMDETVVRKNVSRGKSGGSAIHLVYRVGLRVVWCELHRLVGELRREVGEVPLALQPRPVRWRDLLLFELKCTQAGGH